MKKIKFIMLILIMALIVIFPLKINATQIDPDDYSSSGPSTADVKDMYKFGGSIAGVIQIAGTIVSAGALIIIGIRYVLSSAEEKAEYKERMIPFVIGAVLLFGASNIVNILYNVANRNKAPVYEYYEPEYTGIICHGRCMSMKCKNNSKYGQNIVIYVPSSQDVICDDCNAVLYEAYDNKTTNDFYEDMSKREYDYKVYK